MDRQEAIKVIKDNWPEGRHQLSEALKILIPEFQESEDERIRKWLIRGMSYLSEKSLFFDEVSKDKVIAWLEKHREQKPNPYSGTSFEYNGHIWGMCARDNGVDILLDSQFLKHFEMLGEQTSTNKIGPKFKVGDWVVCCNHEPEQIIGIKNNMYEMSNGDIRPFYMIDNNHNMRLWTIQDAKDGDVLYIHSFESDCVFLYKNTYEVELGRNVAVAYCGIDVYSNRIEFGIQGPDCIDVRNVKPATEKQRDLLFQKMKEVGYEWDTKKKELKKIKEQNPTEDTCKLSDCDKVVNMTEYNNGYKCGEQRVLKYPEDYGLCKKPAWSEEDEDNYITALWHIKHSCGREGSLYNWLKSLKERLKGK